MQINDALFVKKGLSLRQAWNSSSHCFLDMHVREDTAHSKQCQWWDQATNGAGFLPEPRCSQSVNTIMTKEVAAFVLKQHIPYSNHSNESAVPLHNNLLVILSAPDDSNCKIRGRFYWKLPSSLRMVPGDSQFWVCGWNSHLVTKEMKAILSSDSPVVLFIMFFRIGCSEFCEACWWNRFATSRHVLFCETSKKNIRFHKPKFGMKICIVLLMAKVWLFIRRQPHTFLLSLWMKS